MSGDVQPRKRKDKKRKKDELGIEEPRGTAAALGEGDVFMHSQSEHGTGGHWCAKIIFFSLLAILITLIGLIILENRGLSELEANSVETRYSGVLEGWLEDAPDDDHHDEHTLELNHHDDDDGHDEPAGDDHIDEEDEHDATEQDEHSDEEENENDEDHHLEEDDDQNDDDDNALSNEDDEENNSEVEDDDDEQEENNDSEEQNLDDDEDEDEEPQQDEEDDDVKGYQEDDDDDNDDDPKEIDENDFDSNENNENDDENNSNEIEKYESDENVEENENNDKEDEEEHEEEEEDEHEESEIEKLEKEASDEDLEPVSTELPALPEEEDDDDKDEGQSDEKDQDDDEDDSGNEDEAEEDEEFLEVDDADEPPVEKITVPAGEPFLEVEEDVSSEQPPDTLEEEEEYEKRQEELRKQEEQASHKDGGNSVDDLWPGEPADAYWRQQLDSAEQDLRQGSWTAAGARAASPSLRGSARALYVAARALDAEAEARRDNKLLTRAIAAYLELLKMHERLNDRRLLEVAKRALDRIQFRGTYLSAEPVHRLLIRRFPNEPAYRNNLTISFLMANRVDLAETALKETLALWPNDRVALAHYGFVLKTKHKKYEEAAEAFKKALEGDAGAANEPRFYYHYGDSLLLLGRVDEANEVHKRGAELGHFLSASQRSLYNVDRLKSTPWWDVERTPYLRLAKALEDNWREILKEGEAAKASYELEREGLKERGEWSQLDLFVRGRELPACARAPVTCRIVKSEPAAAGCRRGQVKFSLMAPGTHVRAHVGPTNCRLRMHLGLSNTKDTYIRVDKEIRQWQTGKVLVFDDSFEHEVWHNGSAARLVLIADVWHPALTRAERAQLPAI